MIDICANIYIYIIDIYVNIHIYIYIYICIYISNFICVYAFIICKCHTIFYEKGYILVHIDSS